MRPGGNSATLCPRRLAMHIFNDEEILRDMLARLELAGKEMKPETFGAILSVPANKSFTYERLATSVPSDVPKNARILAFLAIGQNTALPHLDGWFLSDFIAFYHPGLNTQPDLVARVGS